MERKSLHLPIKLSSENCSSELERQKSASTNNLAETKNGRRAARLRAVARELRKIGYIVIANHTGTGLVVIAREKEPDVDL